MHDINYLKKELIEGINGYMKITRRDVEGDYSEMVGGASYRNGLSNATWDTRFNSIGIYLEKNCEKFNLLYIKMDRGIWRAPLILDRDNGVLYIFSSTENLKIVTKKIKNGNRTHYIYLLTLYCEDGEVGQLELIEDEMREMRAKKIMGNDISLVKKVAVIHYSYLNGIPIDGTISFLDNTGNERLAIKIDDYLNEKQGNMPEMLDIPSNLEEKSAPLVKWNPKKTEEKQKKGNV